MKIQIEIPNSDEIARKGNGAIFIEKEEDREAVIAILKEVDETEYDQYCPSEFIQVLQPERNYLPYTGKYDIDVKLFLQKCREKKLNVNLFSCRDYNYDEYVTLEQAIQNNIR